MALYSSAIVMKGFNSSRKLTKHFIVLTDAKNISLAREVYGELLCIQDLLSSSEIDS